MIKLTGKLDFTEKDLEQHVESGFKSAFQQTVAKVTSTIQSTAGQKLRKGLGHWQKGFDVDSVGNDTYIFTIRGKLASMMEDGISPGEISSMIMNGNRAKFNKAQGKDYVDVPIDKSQKTAVQVFRDADSLMASFQKRKVNISDFKKNRVKQEDRYLRRVKDLIESKKKIDANSQFMVIRRMDKDSIWPSSSFEGAKSFEAGLEEVAKIFEENLRREF